MDECTYEFEHILAAVIIILRSGIFFAPLNNFELPGKAAYRFIVLVIGIGIHSLFQEKRGRFQMAPVAGKGHARST